MNNILTAKISLKGGYMPPFLCARGCSIGGG